jgi:hypothetical protein
MAFSNSQYTDASRSSFIDVGRDSHQTHNNTTNIHQTIHISFSFFGSQLTPHYAPINLSRNLLRPISTPETLSQGNLVAYHSSDAVGAVDIAVGLIVQITDLLMDRRDSSSGHWNLALEFESLQKTFILTTRIIQKYDNKPLGQSLAKTITPEVLRCCIVLQQLLDSVSGTWLGLHFTSICDLWRFVCWGRLGGDEFTFLRKALSDSRQSLQGVLMAFHSYVLLAVHVPPFTETPSHWMLKLKYCMDGARK